MKAGSKMKCSERVRERTGRREGAEKSEGVLIALDGDQNGQEDDAEIKI